jgi:hypothetical protein
VGGTHVAEVIPGKRYVVFSGADPQVTASPAAIAELRILAYAESNTDVLGPVSDVVMGIAEAIAAGIGTNALWAECTNLTRYVKEKRAQRKPIAEAEATQAAVEALQAPGVPVAAASSSSMLRISNVAADGSLWKIECDASGKPVEAQVVAIAAGTVIDIKIG